MRERRFSPSYFAVIGCAVWIAALAVAPGLAAQAMNPRVTLFGSGSFLKADRTFPAEGETYHSAFAGGGNVGLRLTLDVTGHLSAEGTYSYGTNNLRVSNLSTVPATVAGFGARVQQIDGNILYFFGGPQSGFRPFATVGFGIARISPTSQAKTAAAQDFIAGPATLSSGNKFDFNYGFGVEKKLVRRIGLRFDFRDHVIAPPRLGAPLGPGAAGAGFFPVSGIAHIVDLSVGLVFYLRR